MADLSKLEVTLKLDEEGRTLLATLEGLKAGGRLVTPDLVSELVRDRDQWKSKHDTLKSLLESYKKQWEDHYARAFQARVEELENIAAQQRRDYLDHRADDRVEQAIRDTRSFALLRVRKFCETLDNPQVKDVMNHIDQLLEETL